MRRVGMFLITCGLRYNGAVISRRADRAPGRCRAGECSAWRRMLTGRLVGVAEKDERAEGMGILLVPASPWFLWLILLFRPVPHDKRDTVVSHCLPCLAHS